jgi:3-isopropylmalate/(R)-2-methylmalate dehydratase small subunit
MLTHNTLAGFRIKQVVESKQHITQGRVINIGIHAAAAGIGAGDEVAVDYDTGVITNLTKGETYQAEPFPPFIKEMIAKGGLMASLAAKEN